MVPSVSSWAYQQFGTYYPLFGQHHFAGVSQSELAGILAAGAVGIYGSRLLAGGVILSAKR
jgi:hypothetical protein